MLDAKVIGYGRSTVRHPSLADVKLALCEHLDTSGNGNGSVFLAADWHGTGVGQRVFVTTDGEAAARRIGDDSTPLRNVILGIVDREEEMR